MGREQVEASLRSSYSDLKRIFDKKPDVGSNQVEARSLLGLVEALGIEGNAVVENVKSRLIDDDGVFDVGI